MRGGDPGGGCAPGDGQQDLRLARLAERDRLSIVIAFNKWDAVEERVATRRKLDDVLTASLAQLRGITVVALSAQTGRGVDKLMPAVRQAYGTVEPPHPDRRAEPLVREHADPPSAAARRGPPDQAALRDHPKARPPTIAVFGTRAEQLPEDYRRYLVNGFREAFDMPGVPVRLNLRGTSNPYAEAER